MKKIYKIFVFLALCALGSAQGFSQLVLTPNKKALKSDYKKATHKNVLKNSPRLNYVQQFDVQCTLLNPFPQGTSLDILFNPDFGFVAGTNGFGDKQKANYFDLSATSYTTLSGFLTACYVDVPDSSKTVTWRVFNGTTGTPGAQLASIATQLRPLADSADAGSFNEITFPAPVVLPASKKIFISVDFSNLVIDDDEYFGVISSDSTTPYNLAWEQQANNNWYPFTLPNPDGWGDSLILAILPIVCRDVTTPVSISSFKGNKFTDRNTLYWTTVSESNNKGFELQRSIDGINFSTLAFISTKATDGNSNAKLDYEYSDQKPFNSSNYYRLRQVDNNGHVNFTQIVRLLGISNKLELVSVYPNPVKSKLNVNLLSPKSGSMLFTVTNVTGSTLLQFNQNVTAGDNNISLGVQQLPAGN